MAFKYKKTDRTSEDVTRRAKMSGGSYDSVLKPDIPTFKAKEGDNTIRILPPTWEDTEKWGKGWDLTAWLHRNVGPDNGSYLCAQKMMNKPCPICDARRDMDEEDADALRVMPRPMAWIIDRNNEKAGPQVFLMPITLFRDINARSVDKKTSEVLYIDGADNKDLYGYDVMFSREGNDKRTKYTAVELDRKPTPVHDDEKKERRWLDYISDNPLPELLNFYDPDYIENVLFGKAEKRKRRGDVDEEEERPRKRGRARADDEEEEEERPRRRAAPADDDEEEERPRKRRASRDEEEDEEEEAPRKRRSIRDEGDEEEDTPRKRRSSRDEEEDDEEETPRRRRSSRDEEEDEEDEDDTPKRGRERSRPSNTRSGGRSGGDNEEDEDEDESPTKSAKDRLKGLRARARK